MVSTKLVDGRATMSSFGWRYYQVEIHHARLAPFIGLDRLWRRFDRLDTVPHIRSLGTVAVVGDTMVIGVGGSSATAWSYNVKTKDLQRSPTPAWLNTAWVTPPPAFSPDGRFIAYLSQDNDTSRLTVRSWPAGRIVIRSPPIHPVQRNGDDYRGGTIMWGNPRELHAQIPVVDSGPSWASLSGHVSGSSFEVDRWLIYPDPAATSERVAALGPPPPAQPDTTVQRRFDEAARAVRSLPLSAFPELPEPFVQELAKAGCTIPQSGLSTRHHNVIHGTFASARQLDFAVLCLRGTQSIIKFWWGGPARCVSELAPGTNRSFLEGYNDQIVFARLITTTDFYHDHAAAADSNGVPPTVKLEHDAVVDSFSDKYATIWFCREGRWISIAGAGD